MLTKNGQVIMTPTKCGTHSIEAMLKPLGWEVVLPRHAIAPAEFITIRDPIKRLVSGWKYVTRTGAWPSMKNCTFGEWVETLLVDREVKPIARAPYIWSNTVSDYIRMSGSEPQLILVDNLWENVIKYIDPDAKPAKRNVNRRNPKESVVCNPSLRPLIEEWAREDKELCVSL